jgi:hypothetical protein
MKLEIVNGETLETTDVKGDDEAQQAEVIREAGPLVVQTYRKNPDEVVVVCDLRTARGREVAGLLGLDTNASETIAVGVADAARIIKHVRVSPKAHVIISNTPSPASFRVLVVMGRDDDDEDAYTASNR